MSSPLPILSQKELESISLTRTGSGFALKAFHVPRNADVSLKLLTSQNTTERELKVLLEEVASSRCLQCERLLPSLGICPFQGLLGVVTEWMHSGSLQSLIHERELYPELPFPLCVRILSDVAEGLSYLHSLESPILHYSLKPSNVLLTLEYRAKISDYGLTTWRTRQLASVLHNCNTGSCWDLLCLSPETLQGGIFSREGDVYSFGMLCWESLTRQKPLQGKKTVLEAVTGVCCGLRPETGPEAIPESLPHRSQLLRLIYLCWHQEPGRRPRAAECRALLWDIAGAFGQEIVSDAIYNLMHAKDCAMDAAKGPASHVLETDMRNLEVICAQENNRPDKRITLRAESLSNGYPERGAEGPGKDASRTVRARKTACDAAFGRGRPAWESSGPRPPPHASPSLPRPGLSAGGSSTLPICTEAWKRPPLPFERGSSHSPPCSRSQDRPAKTVRGQPSEEMGTSLLTWSREALLSSMTEGRLNHLLDVLRAQRLLSRTDYEMITSFPTLTGRARAMLDTCLRLGETAAQTVVAVLSAGKGSPWQPSIRANAAPSIRPLAGVPPAAEKVSADG